MNVSLLTEKELVELLRTSKTTARKWAERVGARRIIEGSVRYDAEVVKAALENSSGEKTNRGTTCQK